MLLFVVVVVTRAGDEGEDYVYFFFLSPPPPPPRSAQMARMRFLHRLFISLLYIVPAAETLLLSNIER